MFDYQTIIVYMIDEIYSRKNINGIEEYSIILVVYKLSSDDRISKVLMNGKPLGQSEMLVLFQ